MTSTSRMSMKTVMANALAAAGMAGSLPAATVSVDWLQLAAGGGPGGFSLRNDGGGIVAQGTIVVSSGFALSSPSPWNAEEGFWSGTPPQAEDSAAGDGSVSGFAVRVAPAGGQAAYRVELTVPAGQPLYLMVGELLRTAAAASVGVRIEASSGAGSVPVALIETLAGDDGGKVYSQSLAWDGTTLSTVPGADGESRFAFFEIAPLTGGDARVVLSIPEAYASGTGDSIVFALGVGVIPEPSAALLGGLGMLALLGRRRVHGRD